LQVFQPKSYVHFSSPHCVQQRTSYPYRTTCRIVVSYI
jgi:hypothetical protein